MFLQSLLSKNKTNNNNNNNNNTNITNIYQDEEDLYSAEVATPIETTTKSKLDTLKTSTSIEKVIEEKEVEEVEADISLNFDGDDKDTFVLISGFLGLDTIEFNLPGGRNYTLFDYWSDVKEIVEDPIIVKPSPLGSIHDRAVEIFYQLKGGQVDYGLSHSHQFCHKQLGQVYDGVIPNWDADNPIVLIGKGYGATTALHLQYLLETNFFGQNTSGEWIKGIICLSAPHRGSTLPYLLGLEPGSKCIVHPFSILQFFLTIVHLICYFTCLERFFSFQLLSDKWNLKRKGRDGGEQSLFNAISARSRFAYFGDNFLVDWSVEGARTRYTGEDKDKYRLNPNCVYINYITTGQSWRSKVTGYYWPRLSWNNVPTCLISFFLGRYKFSSDSEKHVLRTSSSTFWENNGILSIYSQQPPPNQPIFMNMALNEKLFDPVEHQLQPGAWYNVYVEDRACTVLFADNQNHQRQPFSLLAISEFLPLMIINNYYYLKMITQFEELFSHENLEYSYIIFIEFFEKHLTYFISKLLFLSSDDDDDVNNNNNNNNYNIHKSNKRNTTINNDNDDIMNIIDYMKDSDYSPKLSYINNNGNGGGSNNNNNNNNNKSNKSKIFDRIVRRTSDKAALDWMSRVETTGVLSSPSRLLYWMNQSHYAVVDNQKKKNNSTINSKNNNRKSAFLKSTDDFINNVQNGQQSGGPTFIKARHKMTAKDYKATVMNGNGPSLLN